MNSSPVTTGAAAVSGAMLSGVIIWLCTLVRVTPPPADVAGTLGALMLMAAHQLAVMLTRAPPPDAPAPQVVMPPIRATVVTTPAPTPAPGTGAA